MAPTSMRDRLRASKAGPQWHVLCSIADSRTSPADLRGAMVALKNILVATDFSEPSGVALAYGRDLARNYNARLHVMHVVEDVMLRYSSEVGLALPALQEDLVKEARKELESRLTDEDREQLKVVPVLDTGANISAAICAYAKANAIDLIITGTHGRGAVSHFLMGSVAERVVRTAPCPVLTVHAHERDFIVPDALAVMAEA
jgi:nucleotide-binding universal stress UspA family protein